MIEYRFYAHIEFYESDPDNGYKLTRVPERDKYIMYGCNINDETAKDVFKKILAYYGKHGCATDDGKHVCELELHVCNNGKTLKSINFWKLMKDIGSETRCKFVLDEKKLERFLDTESDTTDTNNNTTNTNETATDSADGNKETSTDKKTPAELKVEINKKYGVNAVYYDTDSILCDAKKQNENVIRDKSNDNEVYATTTKIIVRDVCDNNEICTITPYENGKELTAPIPKMKCLTCVIDYVKRLYDLQVVSRETYFDISRVGKRDVVLTYTNTHNIVQYYNISDKMQSLATTAIEQYGYYSKYVRKSLKSRQYDVLELYKKDIYLTISQYNDDENFIKDWYCDITYNSAHHIGQYTYYELLHLIDNIRYNTQEYCDKNFD